MAAVTPPLLPSLRPSTPAFISLAVSLCRRKLEAAGNRQADGQGSPWGFLTLFLSPTLSHQISISFSLMHLPDPYSSPLVSLSVPLNLSLFRSAHLLRLIISLSPILPLPVPTHPSLTCSLALPLLTALCFYCVHPLMFSLSSDESQEESDSPSVPQTQGTVVLHQSVFNRCN